MLKYLHPEERGVRICERNNYSGTMSVQKGGGGGAPSIGAGIPPQPMEAHSGAEIHLQLTEETHARVGESLRRLVLEQSPAGTCRPTERGAHTGSGFLVRLAPLWRRQNGEACS